MRRRVAAGLVLLVSSTASAQIATTHWVGTWAAAAAWRPSLVSAPGPAVPLAPSVAPAPAATAPSATVSTGAASATAHRQVVERAHADGLLIYGATLTPFEGAGYFTADGEQKRTTLNQWIRTSKVYDGVIDFDAATRDPPWADGTIGGGRPIRPLLLPPV